MAMDGIGKKISNVILEHSADPVFTLYSDNRLIIDNFILIDYYSTELIKVKTDTGGVIICGKNMVFDTIGDESAVIDGVIKSIELVGRSV